MSNPQQSDHPFELIDPKNDPQHEPLLVPREPQYELIDDCQINNFLRERHDDLANSYPFSDQRPQGNGDDLNFDSRPEEHKVHQQSNHNQPSYHLQKYMNSAKHHSSYPLNNQNPLTISEASQQKSKTTRKCICKKTQCLKMYCECFASNLPCTELCACLDCKNTLKHQKEIIEAKQMIQEKGIVGLHSCSLSQKRCNCKKSNCLKKYCECYNSGVKCSEACKCESCKNCDNPKNDFTETENQKTRKGSKNKKVQKEKKNSRVEVKN